MADPYSGIGAAPDPYAGVGAPPPPAATQRAPGATGFGAISQTVGDLFGHGPADHDPNAIEQGIMDANNSHLFKGVKASYDQAVTNGLFMQPVRAAMEGLGVGRQPGESNQSLHNRYNQAVIAARQQAAQDVAANRIGAGVSNPNLLQRAERFGQQGANLAANIVANPEYMVLPGMGLGGNVATRVAAAGVGNAAIGSVSDAAAQVMDLAEGTKKKFDVQQNLQDTAVSGLFGAGAHGAIEVAPFIKGLFETRGVDTTPQADPRASAITPMTTDHIAMNQADHQQYQQLLKSGSVDDIKQFFQGRNGPQPSWTDVNTWVEHRDGVTRPNGQPVQQSMQPDFNYADEYNGIAEDRYKTTNRQAVEDHVNNQMSSWKNAPQVEVVHGPEDIADPDIKAQALREDANGDALGFLGSDGKVRMFSGRISDPATANAVLYHEGLGHFGLAQKFGDRLDQTLQTLMDRNVNQFSKNVDAWQKANPGAYGGDRTRAAEEVMAEASQNGRIKPSWQNAVSSSVRQFGRKMGLKLAYSDAEVNHILAMSHDAVINGKPGASANGFKGATQDPETKFTIGGVPVDRPPSIEPAPSHLVEDGAPLSFDTAETELPTSEGSGKGYIAKPNTLAREHLDAMLPHAEEAGGRYAPGRADTAFQFRTPEARDQFVENMKSGQSGLKFMRAANEGERPLSRAEQQSDDRTVVFDTRQKEGIEGIFPNSEEAEKFINQHPDAQHLDYATPRELEHINPTGPESPEYEAYAYSKMIDATNQRLRQRGTLPANDADANNKYITKSQLASDPAYKADNLEEAYKALDEGYTPTTRTFDEDRQAALKAGFKPSQIKALQEHAPGDLSTRLYRIQSAANMADAKLSEFHKKLDTPEWSEGDQAKYIEALADFHYLVTRVKGERAEYARALNIAKAAKSYSNSTMEQMGELLEQNGSGLSGLAFDPTSFFKFARMVKDMMEGGNPDGAHVLMAGVNKPYWEQYLTTFHMNMMLSALSTHVKAPIDMGTGIARNVIEKALAIPVGKAREMFMSMTGREPQPGVEPAELAGHIGGIMRAVTDAEVYRRMLHAVKTGESSYVDAAGNHTPTNFANTFGATSNPRIPIVSKPTDLISAQDTFFRSVEINAQLESLGIREAREQLGPKASTSDVMTLGHTIAMDPLPSMIKEAYDLTNRTLLLNNNPLNNMINKARTYTPGMSVGQRVGAFIVTNLAPFIRVESNSLINRVIQRSPLGFIDPTGYTQAQLRAGGAKADIAMTKILYGTALMGMSWVAADQAKNYLTGNGPDNVDKYKERLAAGRSPNAVHEGDRYNTGGQLGMSVNPFDQHNHTAQMIASMRQAYEEGANKGQVGAGLKLALGSMISNLSEMSWVSDLAPAIDALRAHGNEGQNAVQSFAANEARTFSPNGLNQAARLTDPVQRDTSSPDSISGRVGNELMSTVPGLREQLPIKYSVYGTPLQNGASLTGVHTIIPGLSGNGTTETHDPAERELDRLGSLVPSAIITPVSKTITLTDGTKKKLTPAEFENYQRVAGRGIVETVRNEMGTDQWRNMSDQDRVLEVRSIQTDMKKAAREALFDQ